jgi:hypothetical protein
MLRFTQTADANRIPDRAVTAVWIQPEMRGSQHNGFFREKAATSVAPGNRVGFERHLNEMFAEVGMVSDPTRIVDTRNEVIHTGLYGNVHNDETYEFLETALREYFLRVVGYHGPFMPYIGGSPAPHVI